jgi:hypothetical protein
MAGDPLFLFSDNLLELLGLANAQLAEDDANYYTSSAAVTCRVLDTDQSTELVAAKTLSYVSGSDGDYQGNLADADMASLAEDQRVCLHYVADDGPNLHAEWFVFKPVQRRRAA